MISIRLKDVPDYLRKGVFYEELDKADLEDVIEVPKMALYPTQEILNKHDMTHIFHALQYWIVDHIPLPVFRFILETDYSDMISLAQFEPTFPILTTIRYISLMRSQGERRDQQLKVAIQSGHLNLVEVMLQMEWRSYFGINEDAARAGHLDILKYFENLSCREHSETTAIAAIAGGHVHCLEYLILDRGCHSNASQLIDRAAGYGKLECLKLLHSMHTRLLAEIQEGNPFCWNTITCARAASGGSLACLQYAHENGCVWDSKTCGWAAADGQFACLQYALQQDCPSDHWACLSSAENGHLDCLKFAHEFGCEWRADACAIGAAEQGHVDCLRYALTNGCPLNAEVCNAAAQGGSLECLILAHKLGWAITRMTHTIAVQNGHTPCAIYMKEYI